MICEPPYISRQISEHSNLESDRLSLQNMSHFVENFLAVTNIGAYVHMFCSALQFRTKTWYQLLVHEVKAIVKEEDMVKGEEVWRHRTTGFEVESKAWHCVRALEIYQSGLQVKRLQHMFAGPCVIYFLLNSLPSDEVFGLVSNICIGDVASVHYGFMNMVNDWHGFQLKDVFTGTI